MIDHRGVRAIITTSRHVALIDRRRQDLVYYVFPGGSVEPGESLANALIREVDEVLGAHISPGQLVANVTFPDRIQHFFLAEIVDGAFGTGSGPEMTDRPDKLYGTYRPIWMPIADMPNFSVRPTRIAQTILDAATDGWPMTPLSYVESDMWWVPSTNLE